MEEKHDELSAQWDDYARVPAWYPVTIDLGNNAGDQAGNSVQLRPEPFLLKRITWATTGDTYTFLGDGTGIPALGGSAQGRSVLVQWQDDFTRFFGSQQMLVAAFLGDSNGFLDLPRGILFQGRQTLAVNLTRLFWPSSTDPTQFPPTRWDFTFCGLGLVRNQYASGGA